MITFTFVIYLIMSGIKIIWMLENIWYSSFVRRNWVLANATGRMTFFLVLSIKISIGRWPTLGRNGKNGALRGTWGNLGTLQSTCPPTAFLTPAELTLAWQGVPWISSVTKFCCRANSPACSQPVWRPCLICAFMLGLRAKPCLILISLECVIARGWPSSLPLSSQASPWPGQHDYALVCAVYLGWTSRKLW